MPEMMKLVTIKPKKTENNHDNNKVKTNDDTNNKAQGEQEAAQAFSSRIRDVYFACRE
jgi:hypothetical protein